MVRTRSNNLDSDAGDTDKSKKLPEAPDPTVHQVEEKIAEEGGKPKERESCMENRRKRKPLPENEKTQKLKRTKKGKQPAKKSIAVVPQQVAYEFYLAIGSGKPSQIKPFKEYFNIPFKIRVQMRESNGCSCVSRQVRDIEQANISARNMSLCFNDNVYRIVCGKILKRDFTGCIPSFSWRDVYFYPIHAATVFGNVEVLSTVMENGGDLYAKTLPSQFYAFDLALKFGKDDFAAALSDKGFSYKSPKNTRSSKVTSNLISVDNLISLSCQNYQVDRWYNIRLGLKAGLTLSEKTWALNVRDALRRKDECDLVGLLTCGVGDLNKIVWNFDHCILYYAEDDDAVRRLFKHGFDVDRFFAYRKLVRDSSRPPIPADRPTSTILYQLLKTGRYEAADELLYQNKNTMDERGCLKPKRMCTEYGYSLKPLHMCAVNVNQEGLELLIKHGADLNELTDGPQGFSVVSLICSAGAIEESILSCLEIVLKSGVNIINQVGGDGNTPLITAASRQHTAVVHMLMEYGADPSICNYATGANVLWYAIAKYQLLSPALIQLLYANVPESLFWKPVSEDVAYDYLYFGFPYADAPYKMVLSRRNEEALRVVVEAGWFPQKILVSDSHLLESPFGNGPVCEDSLWVQYASTPFSLQWFCKRAIRRSLPVFPHKVINQLPIPEKLQRYVLMVDSQATPATTEGTIHDHK